MFSLWPPRSGRPRLALIGLSGVLGLATVAGLLATDRTESVPVRAPTGPTWALGNPGLKQVQVGLLADVDRTPRRSVRGAVAGLVVTVPWSDLQPQANGELAPDNGIDRALGRVRELRAAGSPGLTLKLRVLAGTSAPGWAKQLAGGPVTIQDDRSGGDSGSKGERGTVGRFWTPEFGSAYRQLQDRLAAAYDDEPELLVASITRCTTFYGEPFLRQAGAPGVARALYAAGFTPEADRRCLRESVAEHSGWRHTRSALAANPYQRVQPDGRFTPDVEFTLETARHCRQVLGAACQLENHSLRWPLQDGPYEVLYDGLLALGGPLSLQSAAPERIGDWQAALRWAVRVKVNSVELNRTYNRYDPNQLQRIANGLQGGS